MINCWFNSAQSQVNKPKASLIRGWDEHPAGQPTQLKQVEVHNWKSLPEPPKEVYFGGIPLIRILFLLDKQVELPWADLSKAGTENQGQLDYSDRQPFALSLRVPVIIRFLEYIVMTHTIPEWAMTLLQFPFHFCFLVFLPNSAFLPIKCFEFARNKFKHSLSLTIIITIKQCLFSLLIYPQLQSACLWPVAGCPHEHRLSVVWPGGSTEKVSHGGLKITLVIAWYARTAPKKVAKFCSENLQPADLNILNLGLWVI